jgi:hypothetical protein
MEKQLPTEILLIIFRFVHVYDHLTRGSPKKGSSWSLKALRLCSRRFNVIASEELFQSVIVAPYLSHLHGLKMISEHPNLRRYVQKIIFSQHVRYEPSVKYYYEVNVPTAVKAIANALSLMPLVREVSFKKGVHDAKLHDFGFLIMCRALSISKTCLHKFTTDYYHRARFYTDTFPSILAGDLEHAFNVFRSLRRISLYTTELPPDTNPPRSLENSLGRILAAAENLEELMLNFDEHRYYRPLSEVLGTHTWPRLRYLYIGNKVTDEKTLTGLIYRHRRTLECLRLDNIAMRTHDDWWTWAEWTRRSSSTLKLLLRNLMYMYREDGRLGRGDGSGEVRVCCLKHYVSKGQRNCNSCVARQSV